MASRNPTCPKCGATMAWSKKLETWFCYICKEFRS